PQPVSITSNVTYTFTIANKGPYPATQAELVELLPDTLTFISASNPQGTWFFDGAAVTFDFNTFTNNATATATIIAKTSIPTQLISQVSVTAAEVDLNPNNNSASLVTTVNPIADLALSQTGPGFGYVFTNATYTLTLANPGPSPAANVVVTDVLPT